MNLSNVSRSLLCRLPASRNLSVHHRKKKDSDCYLDRKQSQEGSQNKTDIVIKQDEQSMNMEKKWMTTQVKQLFQEHSTVIVFHMINKKWPGWDLRDLLVKHKLVAHNPCYPNACYTRYLRQSKYVRMLPLFQEDTGVVVTTNPDEAHLICKSIVQDKHHLLLGGMIDGVLHGPNTLNHLANIVDLKTEHIKLISLLSKPGRDLVTNLSHTPAMLTAVLDKKGSRQ